MNGTTSQFEGQIMKVNLEDGTSLYGPKTLPDNQFTRKMDQLLICGANEKSTDTIESFELYEGTLESHDRRPASLRRWTPSYSTSVGMNDDETSSI